jgi:hypothetical protein
MTVPTFFRFLRGWRGVENKRDSLTRDDGTFRIAKPFTSGELNKKMRVRTIMDDAIFSFVMVE